MRHAVHADNAANRHAVFRERTIHIRKCVVIAQPRFGLFEDVVDVNRRRLLDDVPVLGKQIEQQSDPAAAV